MNNIYEMEKLVKLLNEYSPDYCKDYPDDMIMDEIVISKRFGFIKWLVDNDKIDRDKLEKKVLKEDLIRKFDEGLIMLLAISDTPIDDLISYLR